MGCPLPTDRELHQFGNVAARVIYIKISWSAATKGAAVARHAAVVHNGREEERCKARRSREKEKEQKGKKEKIIS